MKLAQIILRKDVLGGLLISSIGMAALVIGSNYPMGTASRPGPGFLLIPLSGIMVLLGVLIGLTGLRSQSLKPSIHSAGQMLFVLASIAAFGFLISRFGLIPAMTAQILIAMPAYRGRNWIEIALLLIFVQIGLVAVFIFLLGIRMNLLQWPF